MKKNIVINFPKQEKFAILRLNQKPRGLARKSAKSAGLAKSATRSTNTKRGYVRAN